MTWDELFERAPDGVTLDAVRGTLTDRRADRRPADRESVADAASGEREPSPARVVADADVLAADLLVGGDARAAMDHVRAHSWVALVATEPLLDDARAVVAALSDERLAADWREAIQAACERVAQPSGDHPALAAAFGGGAMHLLTLDEGLQSAGAGAAIRAHVETSVKDPAAFARLFDPAKLYPVVVGGEYPGPDRDPRA